MNDDQLETRLRKVAPQEPSGDLNTRMDRLWFDEGARRSRIWSLRIPLWQAAAASLLAAAAGYFAQPEPVIPPAPEPERIYETTVYVMPPVEQRPVTTTSRPMFLELQPTITPNGESI